VKETDIAKVIDRCIAAARNSKPFDAIIVAAHQDSDSSMQTVRTIRDDPAIRNVRIILVTDLGRRGDAAKMKAAGVDGYLTKPVKLAVLAECLGMIFSRAGAPRIETSRDRELITIHDVAESKNKNKVKILLVEDNLINQKVATKMLQKAGYSCDIASNGKEAVEAFALTGYSVILMDCQMPVLSGYDATRAIRDREKEGGTVNHVPIIAMTANTMKGDEEECIACGMDDFISKPFSLAVLVDKIQKWAGSSDL
jgi:CheY-like chemotaxis protein